MTASTVRRAGLLLALVIAGGVLLASNMGFRLSYPLIAAGGDVGGGQTSASGISAICLPYLPGNLQTASDLINDVNSDAGIDVVVGVSRLNISTNQFESFGGGVGEIDFPLEPGSGYRVEVNADVDYYLVGSHDPTLTVTLIGADAPGSLTGQNSYCPPYNALAGTAGELMHEINQFAGSDAVISVARYVRSTDTLEVYTGFSSATDFAIRPGESYLVRTSETVEYTPPCIQ
jgi:hypothetical protein